MKTKAISKGFKSILIIIIFTPNLVGAQTYPFALPASVTATLNVDTQNYKEIFKNNLISVNIDWPSVYGAYSSGYSNSNSKAQMRSYKPTGVRFPQGVWSNFYDWELDARRRYDTYDNGAYSVQVDNNPNLRFGFQGLKELHDELGFDVLWTYNINYDSDDKTLRRLRDSEAKGFNVQNIELGNEHFWADQRSERTSTPQKYVPIAKSISATLKAEKSSIKISLPVSWRNGRATSTTINHDAYNKIIIDDKSYFDALSVHRYIHLDRGTVPVSQASYQGILTAGVMLDYDVTYCRSLAPGKPIWLSEWGVSCGYQAASYLGMADAYLYIFNNQAIYDYTNWFQVNAYNAFFNFSSSAPITSTKTGYGAVFEVIRSVFQDSEMLKSTMATTKLSTSLGASDAVVAKAATRNGVTSVFAVNKTPKSVEFTLQLDGVVYDKTFKHEAMSFSSLSDNPTYGTTQDPLTLIKEGTGTITLPPYSVNRISNLSITLSVADKNLIKNQFTVYPVPSRDGKFKLSSATSWKIFSLLGVTILEGNGAEVDISSFAKGIYVLKTGDGISLRLLFE